MLQKNPKPGTQGGGRTTAGGCKDRKFVITEVPRPLRIAVPHTLGLPYGSCCYHFLLSPLMARGTQPLTYKSIQGCGVIQKLLSQITRANSSHAPDPYWPEKVLFHKHGSQGHCLQTAGCKVAGDEPVHQGGACVNTRTNTCQTTG